MTAPALTAIAAPIETALQRRRPLRLSLPVARWIAVSRERARLRGLTGRELADMGITPEAAAAEAARPFWDLPRR